MGYHYRESGDNGWDILVVTKKGMEEGGLPKGIILLTGILYAERNGAGRKWINDVRASGIIHVSVAKHCDKETELTHISKDGFVNRFGFFLSKEDSFKPGQQDIDIESGWFRRKTVPDYKKFTETFFKIEVISDCRYIVKDTDVEIDKEIVHRYQTQEDAWNAAMLCANRQTFDLSVKMLGSVHMSVNYKEQTISVIGSDNQLKRLYKVTTAANQS